MAQITGHPTFRPLCRLTDGPLFQRPFDHEHIQSIFLMTSQLLQAEPVIILGPRLKNRENEIPRGDQEPGWHHAPSPHSEPSTLPPNS